MTIASAQTIPSNAPLLKALVPFSSGGAQGTQGGGDLLGAFLSLLTGFSEQNISAENDSAAPANGRAGEPSKGARHSQADAGDAAARLAAAQQMAQGQPKTSLGVALAVAPAAVAISGPLTADSLAGEGSGPATSNRGAAFALSPVAAHGIGDPLVEKAGAGLRTVTDTRASSPNDDSQRAATPLAFAVLVTAPEAPASAAFSGFQAGVGISGNVQLAPDPKESASASVSGPVTPQRGGELAPIAQARGQVRLGLETRPLSRAASDLKEPVSGSERPAARPQTQGEDAPAPIAQAQGQIAQPQVMVRDSQSTNINQEGRSSQTASGGTDNGGPAAQQTAPTAKAADQGQSDRQQNPQEQSAAGKEQDSGRVASTADGPRKRSEAATPDAVGGAKAEIQQEIQMAAPANWISSRSESPTASNAATAAPSAPADPERAAGLQNADTSLTQRSMPTKEISMHLASPESAPVDIRLVDRAGSLRVAVHTSDADLAQNLQSGLNDLVHRLEHKGFEAEAWSPGERLAGGSGPAASAHGEGSESGGNSGKDPRDSSQQRFAGQNQNGRNRPKWVDELEQNLATGEVQSQ